MAEAPQEIIRKTVETLLEKMGFEASIQVMEESEGNAYFCKVRVEKDQNILIGQYGANLAAIQHIVRVIITKKTQERFGVVVDINDYYAEKRDSLEKEAEKAIREALRDSAPVVLRAMLPYERKIIHTFVSKNEKVTTESVGKGGERKIIVRPRLEGEDIHPSPSP